MTAAVMATVLNAVSNASRDAVSEADLLPILSTGDGPRHAVRALFGDCSFETLDRLAASLGLSRSTLRTSYAEAKRLHGAANADLDAEKAENRFDGRLTPPPPPASAPARS